MSDPFVKLYSTLLESSLWWGEDAATRLVWITLLVAADHEGMYLGTLPGLAGKARVTLEEARHAIWRLQQPDEESRTKTSDGRRIEVIEGVGYKLINYQKYRDKRSPKQIADAAYKAAQRAREKSDMSGCQTQILDLRSSSSSLGPGSDLLKTDPDPLDQVRITREPSRFVPDAWKPNDGHAGRCAELGLELPALEQAFREHEFNRAYSDWDRRFSKWLTDERARRETAAHKSPKLRFEYAKAWQPKPVHREFGLALGLTDEDILERASIAKNSVHSSGFINEDNHFKVQLHYTVSRKRLDNEIATRKANSGKHFETPGHDRADFGRTLPMAPQRRS